MGTERFVDPFDSSVASAQESLRTQVMRLEDAMRKEPDQIHIEPVHYFAHGLYAREITIPKGAVLTGKIHLFEHINVISKGDISVLTEDGGQAHQGPGYDYFSARDQAHRLGARRNSVDDDPCLRCERRRRSGKTSCSGHVRGI